MTVRGSGLEDEQELLLVVERLSTQDRRRIVNLVELLSRAPDDVRIASQHQLRRLLAQDSMTHGECLKSIDSVLAGIVLEARSGEAAAPAQDFPPLALTRAASGG